jgi:hypothetical protein
VGPYVPGRCMRSPNASFDRGFGIYVCQQRDGRCVFHGPVYVLAQDGRRYECRKAAERQELGVGGARG